MDLKETYTFDYIKKGFINVVTPNPKEEIKKHLELLLYGSYIEEKSSDDTSITLSVESAPWLEKHVRYNAILTFSFEKTNNEQYKIINIQEQTI